MMRGEIASYFKDCEKNEQTNYIWSTIYTVIFREYMKRREKSWEHNVLLIMGGGTRYRCRPQAQWLGDAECITECTPNEQSVSSKDRDACGCR